MSTGRARANHHLYLARIVQRAWSDALRDADVQASALAQAFLPAARGHLLDAYGWFLLEVANPAQWPERPPHSCVQLPPRAEGVATSGEIREFQQLETEGWLAQVLAEPQYSPRPQRIAGNLAVVSTELPDPEVVARWAAQLETLFDRMSDSLDEY